MEKRQYSKNRVGMALMPEVSAVAAGVATQTAVEAVGAEIRIRCQPINDRPIVHFQSPIQQDK